MAQCSFELESKCDRASLGPASKRARVCSDEAGPSSRTETREHSNEQKYEPPQREPETSATSSERYYWLYEGRGGWWRFDPRLEKDLENGRRSGESATELLICGFQYEVNFDRMVQFRKDGPTRTRNIKRVSGTEFREMSEKGMLKGISGVRLAGN